MMMYSLIHFENIEAEQPTALYVSNNRDVVAEILEQSFSVEYARTFPHDLGRYNLVVANDIGSGIQPSLEDIRKYVRDGGGYAYISGAAYWSDLSNNSWLGASYADYTGESESAFVSIDNPLGTNLTKSHVLKVMLPNDRGAQLVSELQDGAITLAEYGGGGVFAYVHTYGDGRIYYQADTDPTLAEDREAIKVLMSAGFKWATGKSSSASTTDFAIDTIATGRDSYLYNAGETLRLYAKITNTGKQPLETGCITAEIAAYAADKKLVGRKVESASILGVGDTTYLGFDTVVPTSDKGWYSLEANVTSDAGCGSLSKSLIRENALLLLDKDQLPGGTRVLTDQPFAATVYYLGFADAGAQTKPFSDQPTAPVRGIWVTVTTYVKDAILYFTADGKEYSIPVNPNSKTQLTFPSALNITNVSLSILDRGYPDDAGNIEYYYEGSVIPSPDFSGNVIPTIVAEPSSDYGVYAIVAIAASSAAGYFAWRHARRHGSELAEASELIAEDNKTKGEVLKELGDELGSNLNPSRDARDLLDRFRHEKS